MPPRKRAEPAPEKTIDERLAELEHQVGDISQAIRIYSDRVRQLSEREPELTAATEGLTHTVDNLGGAITKVNELAASQQQIEAAQVELSQAQIELERKVVLQDAFDAAWEQNAGALVKVARNGRLYALAALLIAVVFAGAVAGGFINYQVDQNHHNKTVQTNAATLNKQRVQACEQKTQALRQGVSAFTQFIQQEQSRVHPDLVIVEVLELVRLSTQAQIVPCPGATAADVLPVHPLKITPGATPTFTLPPAPTPTP